MVDGEASAAVFRPVREGNAFEETVQRVLQAIRLGVVGAGERLPPERELAERLAVSRVTLREAIRSLTEAGYVESRRGRYGGTFVCAQLPSGQSLVDSSPADLADVLALRQVLETGAAELAANRSLSPQLRRHLRACLDECADAEPADYRRKDSRLHLAIAEATGAPSVIAAVADVRTRLNTMLDRIPLLPRNIDHSDDQHDAIVTAILDGNPTAARSTMAEHLDGTATLLHAFLT